VHRIHNIHESRECSTILYARNAWHNAFVSLSAQCELYSSAPLSSTLNMDDITLHLFTFELPDPDHELFIQFGEGLEDFVYFRSYLSEGGVLSIILVACAARGKNRDRPLLLILQRVYDPQTRCLDIVLIGLRSPVD
jgi:hypothetical protein